MYHGTFFNPEWHDDVFIILFYQGTESIHFDCMFSIYLEIVDVQQIAHFYIHNFVSYVISF